TIEKLLKIKLVNQERAREVLQDRQELDQNELSYAGADENAAFTAAPAPMRAPPNQTAQQPGTMQYGYGPGPEGLDDRPQMNREQRRRMEKQAKKKRIKI